jgi:hypothetical protein
MSQSHTIRQGEHASSVAAKYAFRDYRTVWESPDNALLREQRQNPNVLAPGDEVVVPDKAQKAMPVAVDMRHRFRAAVPNLWLRVTLHHFDDRPLANLRCEMSLDTGKKLEVNTDETGTLETRIPRTAKLARLTVLDSGAPFDLEIPIQIGDLDPVELSSGQIARLNNLGYFVGDVADADEKLLRYAIEEFQVDHELTVTGQADQPTQDKLLELHGC